jgi:hypothetical protein
LNHQLLLRNKSTLPIELWGVIVRTGRLELPTLPYQGRILTN